MLWILIECSIVLVIVATFPIGRCPQPVIHLSDSLSCFFFSFVTKGPDNGRLESCNCSKAVCVFFRWVQRSVTERMSSFVLIEWLCISLWPTLVRLMMGAKPSLRLIHYHGLISLQTNITPWITILLCHVGLWTSLDQFAVCNFLFRSTEKEIIVCAFVALRILKIFSVFYMSLQDGFLYQPGK